MKDLDNLPLGKRLREPFVSFEHGFRPIASPTPATDALREVVGLHFANVVGASPTPTPPPEEVAGLVERLTKRYTADPVPPCSVCGHALNIARGGGGQATEYACPKAPLDFNDTHYDRSKFVHYRPGDADVIALLDVIASLSAQVAGSGWRPIATVQMWEVAVVTDGENVAIAQLAESDIGDPYWSIDPEDTLEWEPTLWTPVPSIAGGEDGRG